MAAPVLWCHTAILIFDNLESIKFGSSRKVDSVADWYRALEADEDAHFGQWAAWDTSLESAQGAQGVRRCSTKCEYDLNRRPRRERRHEKGSDAVGDWTWSRHGLRIHEISSLILWLTSLPFVQGIDSYFSLAFGIGAHSRLDRLVMNYLKVNLNLFEVGQLDHPLHFISICSKCYPFFVFSNFRVFVIGSRLYLIRGRRSHQEEHESSKPRKNASRCKTGPLTPHK